MKQMHYAFQALLRGGGTNVIKIISLTLGIFVGVLLFARVAFEFNYDNHYADISRLYYLQRQTQGQAGEWITSDELNNYEKMAATLCENFPTEIESATTLSHSEARTFFYADRKFDEIQTAFTDESIFITTGIPLIEGNESALKEVDIIFISRSFARKLFGDSKAIGQMVQLKLFDNDNYPLTVRGVFEDIPENSEIYFDVLYNLPTYRKMLGITGTGWGYDTDYFTLVRLHPDTSPGQVETRIGDMMKNYLPQTSNVPAEKYSFASVKGYHANRSEVRRTVGILSILAFVLLLIATLNYVLISLSSLDRRSKAIGVHKCSGASGRNIFGMFLCETGLVLLIVLVLVIILLYNFREQVEYIAEASLTSLFTWQVLWVPTLVVVGVFLIASIIPGSLFATIPVTQVFRRYTEHRSFWKRPLLFVQFMGVPFIIGLLMIILLQYHHVMTKDLGYNPHGIVTVYNEFPNPESLFRSLPMVEDYCCASAMTSGYNGETLTSTDGHKFSARIGWADYRFVPVMGVQILEGRNIEREGEALVNEEYVRQMKYAGSLVGQTLSYLGGAMKATIVGVMVDYPINSAYFPQDPVVSVAMPDWGAWTLRLKPPYNENLQALNAKMKEMFPTQDIVFRSLEQILDLQYDSVRRFRNAVWLASVSVLLIAIIGVLGYTNDEVHRRSKEIAIRKVNGAEASNILKLLSKEIIVTAFPAIVLGTIAAWFIGSKWLEQFNDVIYTSAWWFVGVAIGALTMIVSCVVLKAWHIANENPVKSIKSE